MYECKDLAVAVARHHAFAHENPQVARETCIGVEDALVLADETAQLAADVAGARLLGRIVEHLGGVEREGRGDRPASRTRKRWQGETSTSYSAGWAARRRVGAPIEAAGR